VFEQLGRLLEHLGEREIATWNLGGLKIQVDPKTLVMSWLVMAIVIGLALFLRRAFRQPIEDKPNRIQALLDVIMGLLESQFAGSFSSSSFGARMFPFISTLFLYVLVSNWLSLLPGLEAPTADPNVTLGLALLVLVMSHVYSIRAKGLRRYAKEFIEPSPIMLPITIMSEVVARPLSHAFRLFGNMFAEMVLVTVVMAKLAPLVLPMALRGIFGLGNGFIQAFVFSMLAVAYINLAVEH